VPLWANLTVHFSAPKSNYYQTQIAFQKESEHICATFTDPEI